MEPQTNDTLTQTPPVTQPIPPKKNFSLIIIFSTLLLGLLGGVIYLAYQNNLLRQQLSSPVVLPQHYPLETPPPTPTPSPTPDPTADWKTYTNNDHSFSFKYPLDYEVLISPTKDNEYNITVHLKTNTSERGFVPIQFSINMAKDEKGNPLTITLIKEAKTYYIKSFNSASMTVKDITIADQPAVSITGLLAGPGPGGGSPLYLTLVQLNNEVLVIQLGNKDYQVIFNQILSTFKFIN